jgi:hypothetical protein
MAMSTTALGTTTLLQRAALWDRVNALEEELLRGIQRMTRAEAAERTSEIAGLQARIAHLRAAEARGNTSP